MNYGVILASGKGTRMKTLSIPKQYYLIDNQPIFIYTLISMLEANVFDKVYLAIHEDYYDMVKEYINKFVSSEYFDKIVIVFGGKERIDTIHNVIKEISKNEIGNDDVIVIHDAVRPFVTKKILEDSVVGAREYGAVVASMPAEDTMLISNDGKLIESIPNRSILFRGQAPDSFRLKTLIELEDKLNDDDKKIINGTSQICTLNNYPMHMIPGDAINFKITTDSDLEVAKNIILSKRKKLR